MRAHITLAFWIGLGAAATSCTQVLGINDNYQLSTSGGATTAEGGNGGTSASTSIGAGVGGSAPAATSATSSNASGTVSCSSGLTTCGVDCVDILADPKNCGACGHDCAGQPCDQAVCTPTTLASGEKGPLMLVVAGNFVYWANNEGTAVRRAPITGGPAKTLASGEGSPIGLTTDGTFLYWTDRGLSSTKGAVKKVSIEGGTSKILSGSEEKPDTIVFAGGKLYWGAFMNGGVVKSISPEGGAVTQATTIQSSRWCVASDAKNVYWASSEGTIQKQPLGGGAPVTLTQSAGDVKFLAANGSALYWTTWNVSAIKMLPVDGGTLSVLADDPAGTPFGITVDDQFVYWTDDATNLVKKVPVGGGNATLVARGQDSPSGIVVDGQNIYWVNWGGTVMKTPK